MSEDFSKLPVSLAERRGQGDCDNWSPRDLLIYMLRRIDNGELIPTGIVVSYFRSDPDGRTLTGMKRSKCTVMQAVAMCEMAKHDLLSG